VAGTLPNNAQDYADATFQAWLDGDHNTLDEMAVADAVTTLEDNTPSDPSSWSMSGCDAGTGQVECTYTSTAGDTLKLRVDNAMASGAEPQAVIEAQFS
jgi:ketosteroid isomerase-like protein